ncbi:alpha/beta fold hydrolase [Novosphingobium sp. CECT 9465]|uniref:alpha/beta fold hydrolase n=1 Tax=Novosphingobium sp. CECT 9465 TaxID=2829794 RepID=UPI001E36F939|nr:alpha/beta hydrolase [Novosphingobium sp. CECT 9465]CAH0495273.1 2-hydroxy-6-oxo-6-(2'-aminophenyl)hexa-2, 4-dienoic acid hydrolase [Novosphingobium sp. CECT 9465]
MPTITIPGGETIWYKKTGTGKPVLQIHGSAFGHHNFARMTPLMAESFEVIDFDLPGYGESTGSLREGGMAGIAEIVYEFIVALGYDKVSLHGTSFGAMIGVNLAARHPEVIDRLVFSCFVAKYDLAARMMRKTWKQAARDSGMTAVTDLTSVAGFARGYYERPEAQAQFDEMYEAFSATEPEAFIKGTETIEATDLSPLLPRLTMPTLLLGGAEDNMTPFRTAPSGVGFSQIATILPNCEMHILEDCGHYLVIEQPAEAARLATEFLLRA